MSAVRSFRDLIAWQRAMTLTELVYRWSAALPADERFGLVSQVRRASVSIVSNIAEGFGKGTTAEFIRRLRDARGSLAEVETQLELGERLHAVPVDDALRAAIDEAGRVLQGLISSLEERRRREEEAGRR